MEPANSEFNASEINISFLDLFSGAMFIIIKGFWWDTQSPKDSGTKNGGTEPYKTVFGWEVPLHQPYPYSDIGEDSFMLSALFF